MPTEVIDDRVSRVGTTETGMFREYRQVTNANSPENY
jgi:hypothetical protein